MLYLFTDLEFGSKFLSVLTRLQLDEALECTVVLSGKRGWPKSRFKRMRAKLLWPLFKLKMVRRVNKEFGLRVIITDNINSTLILKTIGLNDHGFVAGFNQIFNAELISRFQTLVNCHPSILPFYRGPVPSFWCIHHGEKYTGFTFHQLSEKIDRGAIQRQEVISISDKDTPQTLNGRIAECAARVFGEYVLWLLGKGEFGRSTVDATSVYATHVGYKSFPG